jgi:hypothetical protein
MADEVLEYLATNISMTLSELSVDNGCYAGISQLIKNTPD